MLETSKPRLNVALAFRGIERRIYEQLNKVYSDESYFVTMRYFRICYNNVAKNSHVKTSAVMNLFND